MPDRSDTASGGADATLSDGITLTFEPWMLAEIRRQLYIDLMECLEHAAKEAHSAAESGPDPHHDNVVGDDIRNYMHKTIGDGVKLLDAIGWDVAGDTELLHQHAKDIDREKGLES